MREQLVLIYTVREGSYFLLVSREIDEKGRPFHHFQNQDA